MKKLSVLSVLLLIIIVIILVGCDSKSVNETKKLETCVDLILALKSKEFKVDQPMHVEKNSYFSVPAQFIDLNGERVTVYEYQDSNAAKAEAQTISKDGSPIGNTFIEWVGVPHFFQKGNLIVGYIGSNKKILNALTDIVGEPITNQ